MTLRHTTCLVLILLGSLAIRLHQINSPLFDGMGLKQIFVAHKARAIAGPPFNPLASSFDFLAPDGQRLVLTEEIPLYPTLLAAAQRVVGEANWPGRLLSNLATLLATLALFDIARRELGEAAALPAAFFFSFNPLLHTYGQTVQPDACMLAGVLISASAFGRFLDGRGRAWWLVAAVAYVIAALFKYYALLGIVPLIAIQMRRDGWRGLFSPSWILIGAAGVAPIGLWMATVFLRTPNPAAHAPYFLFQMPQLLWEETLYLRFFDRFLWKDCGPMLLLFIPLGLKRPTWRLWSWTLLGLGFYVLLGPLLRCHDYYELLMMPAAALWAAQGWVRTAEFLRELPRWRLIAGTVATSLVVIIHSPWVITSKASCDRGLLVAAQRLETICPTDQRVLVVGPLNGIGVLHYARREGWIVTTPPTKEEMNRYRALGARYAVYYVSFEQSLSDRTSIATAAKAWPDADTHRSNGLGSRRRSIFHLVDLAQVELEE